MAEFMPEWQIDLTDVSKSYGNVVGLAPTSIQVRKGEFFSLLGPSGCGKSTLLKLIAGFEEPTTGRILVGGQDMGGIPPERRRIGFVFQNYALFPNMNVFENIAFGLRARRAGNVAETVERALEMVELSGLSTRRPTELSGGQQQRVALARAIAIKPEVLLLDEPLAALDKKLRQSMQRKLVELQRELDITTIFVTHDQEEALTMSDRVAVFSAERHSVEQIGTPKEIYRRPTSEMVTTFLGHSNLVHDTIAKRASDSTVITNQGFEILGSGQAGDRLSFSLRPESIDILGAAAEQQAGQQLMRGKVTHVTFLGDGQMYEVEVGHDTTLKVRTLDKGEDEFQIGQTVWLRWPTKAGLALISSAEGQS